MVKSIVVKVYETVCQSTSLPHLRWVSSGGASSQSINRDFHSSMSIVKTILLGPLKIKRLANVQELDQLKTLKSRKYPGNDIENGWVFSRWRNVDNDSADVTSEVIRSVTFSLFPSPVPAQ